MTPAKPWYLSKTLWLNGLVATLVLAEANLHLVTGLLPVSLYQTVAFLLPLANLWLRLITRAPVTLSAAAPGPLPVDPADAPSIKP